MDNVNFQNACFVGIGAGAALAVTPALATAGVACSKIILINVIANVVTRILTLNMYSMTVYGISLVPVPFICWQISLGCAAVGGSIAAVSLVTLGAYELCQWYMETRKSRHA